MFDMFLNSPKYHDYSILKTDSQVKRLDDVFQMFWGFLKEGTTFR